LGGVPPRNHRRWVRQYAGIALRPHVSDAYQGIADPGARNSQQL